MPKQLVLLLTLLLLVAAACSKEKVTQSAPTMEGSWRYDYEERIDYNANGSIVAQSGPIRTSGSTITYFFTASDVTIKRVSIQGTSSTQVITFRRQGQELTLLTIDNAPPTYPQTLKIKELTSNTLVLQEDLASPNPQATVLSFYYHLVR